MCCLPRGNIPEAREAYRFSYQFFQTIHEKGWMLTALTGLSRAEFALGERSNARRHARQALQLFSEMQMYTFFAYLTVAEIALLLVDKGEVVRALELYGMVLQQGYLAQSRWFARFVWAVHRKGCHRFIMGGTISRQGTRPGARFFSNNRPAAGAYYRD